MIDKQLLALNDKYDNAIAIFGGAYWAYQVVQEDGLTAFIPFLDDVIMKVKFYGWHEPIPVALRRFCHLCLVDPTLVEAYIGQRFEVLI